jgi:hypothetical protein
LALPPLQRRPWAAEVGVEARAQQFGGGEGRKGAADKAAASWGNPLWLTGIEVPIIKKNILKCLIFF